ncbi:MAG: hypothetical protein GY934_18050 [Gammaproteobacteria bacterium]|nr:hypothetical protein [Gammaproteobacteria bacterium]
MINSDNRCLALVAVLLLFVLPLAVQADPVSEQRVWELISDNKCSEARQLVQGSEQAGGFIASAGGESLYAKCLCCSPANELSPNDISNAVGHLEAARQRFDPLSDSMKRWLDDATHQCKEKRESLTDPAVMEGWQMLEERVASSRIRSNYAGKVMSRCTGGNLSPTLVPGKGAGDHPKWHYVAPVPSAVGGEIQPSEAYLRQLTESYVDSNPIIAVCAPFVALSSEQDPENICKAAHRFTNYFTGQFGARRPPVWIALIHYPQSGKQLYKHAKRTTGEIRCDGVLGYFDWRRQALVYRAPAGFYGTFQHELTHALMFWDMPLVPRWFDEGLAALYEHTDGGFQGLPNPWRQDVLKRAKIQQIDSTVLRNESLHPSLLEFEASPVAATVAREYIRQVQRCGDLPGLYQAIKQRSRREEFLSEQKIEPHRRAKNETVNDWEEIVNLYDKQKEPSEDCD